MHPLMRNPDWSAESPELARKTLIELVSWLGGRVKAFAESLVSRGAIRDDGDQSWKYPAL